MWHRSTAWHTHRQKYSDLNSSTPAPDVGPCFSHLHLSSVYCNTTHGFLWGWGVDAFPVTNRTGVFWLSDKFLAFARVFIYCLNQPMLCLLTCLYFYNVYFLQCVLACWETLHWHWQNIILYVYIYCFFYSFLWVTKSNSYDRVFVQTIQVKFKFTLTKLTKDAKY